MPQTQFSGSQIGPLSLTTEVTGVLPIANGGTNGSTPATARAALATNEAVGFLKMTVGTVAPTSPTTGDLWVDTN